MIEHELEQEGHVMRRSRVIPHSSSGANLKTNHKKNWYETFLNHKNETKNCITTTGNSTIPILIANVKFYIVWSNPGKGLWPSRLISLERIGILSEPNLHICHWACFLIRINLLYTTLGTHFTTPNYTK